MTVSDIANQDSVVQSLTSLFEHTTVIDRRQQPSHGYRAVHVIVRFSGKVIEIQVRTSLQHLWAELSEKFSDVIDPAIKYGGGHESFQILLIGASELVATEESLETQFAAAQEQLSSQDSLPDSTKQQLAELLERRASSKQMVFQHLRDFMEFAEKLKGEN